VTVTPGTPVPDLVSWPSMTASEPAVICALAALADSSDGPAIGGVAEAVGEAEGVADADPAGGDAVGVGVC
jgi:hypothetical protein